MTTETIRYLEAKRTVDERSLSPRLVEQLLEAVPPEPTIFEAGCGTGVTLSRLCDWGLQTFTYHGVDTAEPVLEYAREQFPASLPEGVGAVRVDTVSPDRSDSTIRFQFEQADAVDAVTATSPDLVIAQQFMDLVEIEQTLDRFLGALSPGGLAYFPLTFDGVTVFQPAHAADERVIDFYHRSMDDRPGAGSRSGRKLIDSLRDRPGTLLGVASSDAIIRPENGSYPNREAYVIDRILDFFEGELSSESLSGADDWLRTRRRQLADGELVYIAHRYDLLYQCTTE